jgi:hypothetical protein
VPPVRFACGGSRAPPGFLHRSAVAARSPSPFQQGHRIAHLAAQRGVFRAQRRHLEDQRLNAGDQSLGRLDDW